MLEQQSDNSNKKLSKAIADYPDADLPILDTDDLLVNQGGVWKKVNKSELFYQDKIGNLFNYENFTNLNDFTASGSTSFSVENNKLKVTGNGAFNFTSRILNNKITNVEDYIATAEFTMTTVRTSNSYGLAFLIQSICQFYKYSFYCIYDTSINNPTSGKFIVYSGSSDGATFSTLNTSHQTIPMNINDVMRYKVVRNKNNFTFILENITQNKKTSFYFKSSLTTGFPANQIVNNVCKFGFSKNGIENFTFFVNKFQLERQTKKNIDYLFLGDSITFGYEVGADIYKRYGDLIFSNTKSKKTHEIYGQPGNATIDVLNLFSEINEINPVNLVINIGMNDAQNNVLATTLISNIQTLINGLDSNINIIFLLIKPFMSKIALITEYNNAIINTFQNQYQIVDTFNTLISSNNSNLHPTLAESEHMAQIIQSEIKI
jgi:lysophospholipase L1-like esterase